jgi:hypothetical protein
LLSAHDCAAVLVATLIGTLPFTQEFHAYASCLFSEFKQAQLEILLFKLHGMQSVENEIISMSYDNKTMLAQMAPSSAGH